MKKITFAIGSLCQGGAERVCVNLANEMAKEGLNIEIIVSKLDDPYYLKYLSSDISIKEIGSRNLIDIFKFYFNITSLSERLSIISFNYNISFVLVILKLFKKIKLTSRAINNLTEELKETKKNKKIKNAIITWTLNMSDFVVAQSIGMANDLIKNGVKETKITIINNPISEIYTLDKSKRSNFIIFAGRLVQQKNLFDLIDILTLIDKNILLYIAGNGPLKNDLVKYIKEKHLTNRVVFLGIVENLKDLYSSAICTVLTSNYEGFPNVLLESISCGTPVVSYDCPSGPSEIIEEGINGYLIEFGDKLNFSEKVNLLSKNPIPASTVKETSYKFNSKNIIKKYLDLLY